MRTRWFQWLGCFVFLLTALSTLADPDDQKEPSQQLFRPECVDEVITIENECINSGCGAICTNKEVWNKKRCKPVPCTYVFEQWKCFDCIEVADCHRVFVATKVIGCSVMNCVQANMDKLTTACAECLVSALLQKYGGGTGGGSGGECPPDLEFGALMELAWDCAPCVFQLGNLQNLICSCFDCGHVQCILPSSPTYVEPGNCGCIAGVNVSPPITGEIKD